MQYVVYTANTIRNRKRIERVVEAAANPGHSLSQCVSYVNAMSLCCTVSRGGCCNSIDCLSMLVAADLSSIVVRSSYLYYRIES
ncbi:hypothetical protein IGI01_24910 [Bacillus thuringiensis]|nr:hypothetical protein [Bacillus thuringiensis]